MTVILRRPVRRLPRLSAHLVAATAAGLLTGLSGSAHAQAWKAGTGSWFDALNWDPQFVPIAGGGVIVSNSGHAQLAAPGVVPLLGTLSVGLAGSGTGSGRVSSDGVALATSGSINVGMRFDAGSFANGVLGISGAGAQAGGLNVGLLLNGPDGSIARGSVAVAQSLLLFNGQLQVGHLAGTGAGSTASGAVTIGGDAGTANGFAIVGNVSAATGNDGQVGSRASGRVDIGGNLALGGGANTFIGTTFGPDRSVDGTRINEARGAVTVGGTLTLAPSQFITIGRTDDGRVGGSLTAAIVEMAGGPLAGLVIGSSGSGSARGEFDIRGGRLEVGSLFLGLSNGGTAVGTLALSGAQLDAERVLAGTGGGRGEILLRDATATVDDTLEIFNGLLSLERSLLEVGTLLTLGEQAQMHIGIEGFLRGTEFGAIDALFAELDGALSVDFSELAFSSGSMVFDLLRSGSSDGISGDFTAFNFTGLPAGYSVLTGIELDGVEVYRLRLARNDVPEPAGMSLALLALGLLTLSMRRRSSYQARSGSAGKPSR